MRHLEFFGVENFRVFRERTDFDLKSINILVGANSTGKSSFTKSLRLFAATYNNELEWIGPFLLSLKKIQHEFIKEDHKPAVDSPLDFDNTDNSLRLGGVENVLPKESKNEKISFILPFELFDYPKLGERTILKLKVIFLKKDLTGFEFYFQDSDELLIKFDFEYIYFNLPLFLSKLETSDEIKIFRFEDEMYDNNAVRLTTKRFQKGRFGLVDYSKPRIIKTHKADNKPYFIEGDPIFGKKYYEGGEHFTPLYIYSNKKQELVEILNFYKLKKWSISKKDVSWWEDKTEIGNSSKESGNNIFGFNNFINRNDLVWELFKYNNLSQVQSDYLNNIFRGFFSRESLSGFYDDRSQIHVFLAIWKNLSLQIAHHQGLIEQPKYSYQLGDESDLNKAIKEFIDVEREQESLKKTFKPLESEDIILNFYKPSDFLKKWASEKGFGFLGDIKIEESVKYAVRSIEIGEMSLSAEGQGIAQIVSLLFAVTSSRDKIFIVEEPENGLHPSYQSKLADFFIDAGKQFGHQFIIETHSEYLIRRLQYLIAKKEYKAEDAVIYNFRKATEDNDEIVKRIDILEDGSLTRRFYPGFYDESDNQAIALFNLNNQKN